MHSPFGRCSKPPAGDRRRARRRELVDVYRARPGGNAAGVTTRAETQYDPDDDPDTDPPTPPEEVQQDSERDQAEGEPDQVGGEDAD